MVLFRFLPCRTRKQKELPKIDRIKLRQINVGIPERHMNKSLFYAYFPVSSFRDKSLEMPKGNISGISYATIINTS